MVKAEISGKDTPTRPGSSYPAVKSSKIDVDAKPIYEANGKPITEIDMDAGNLKGLPFRRISTLIRAYQIFQKTISPGDDLALI